MRAKGIVSTTFVFLLCLPTLAGGVALLSNFLRHRTIGEWGLASSVSVASAVMFGTPLVLVAMIVGGVAMLSLQVSRRIKLADAIILGVAVMFALIVSSRFRI